MPITFWHWLIVVAVLMISELFFPGAFMLWIAIAALCSAAIAFFVPDMLWQWQLVLFAIFSVASVVVWHKYIRTVDRPTDQPNLNKRSQQYIGRTFQLVEPIENGTGKVIVDDSQWRVVGEDAAKGAKVKVVGVDGVLLLVEVIA